MRNLMNVNILHTPPGAVQVAFIEKIQRILRRFYARMLATRIEI